MAAFAQRVRAARIERGWSLSELAAVVPCDKGHLSRIENGGRRPTAELARRIDEVLGARGDIVAASHLDAVAADDARPWETAELLRRVQANDAGPATVEALHATVVELCCQYATQPAAELRGEAHGWMREVARLLHRPTGLAAHRELLVAAGWLALLVGCVEYDLGMRAGAEATRTAARQLGDEAGHPEIIAWAQEMAAWFALTQSRYRDVLTAAQAGQAVAPSGSAAVQLAGQEAKAFARLGDVAGVQEALGRGRALLDRMPAPDRPDHHFVVDPDKWDFYAMDAYRLAGDDERAARHARTVLTLGAGPDGERAPMRMAEARLTLAAVAARAGNLEEAVSTGVGALAAGRRSLPSLLMVAGELDVELHRRFAGEPAADGFREALRDVR
ncbi:helix-turn-helix domain-containing protein [Couchioplanes caeruleus]|uniref:XRE family transcriptional regulator n=2 Tax=Couchioplanes caeruleus TaxID=56438 RepID=A0A1K0GMU4_9ACTN|nr:helix-turn-helix transcriptional regulator [Couchioplanes caeruleus]OJF13678.1 XRE family transcriptional regulator [Couchioplanes caeruleus subsp. caeruleus]ROP28962.1 helix-turn-helix protein [Couchioplanes caeruleus]